MREFDSKSAVFEKLSNNSNKASYSWGLLLRLYEAFRLSDDENYLQKAILTSVLGAKRYKSSLNFYFACAFLHTEAGNEDTASEYLAILKNYRGFLKNNDPVLYGAYSYINAVFDINIKGKSNVKKHIKVLVDLKARFYDSYFDLMLSDINLRLGEYTNALFNIENAYENGCRSFLLYIIYGALLNNKVKDRSAYLLIPYLKWCLNQGFIHDYIIEDNVPLIEELIGKNALFFERLYKNCESESLLTLICLNRLSYDDLSWSAFNYYKLAEHKKLNVPGINEILIRSAYKLMDEDLSLYAVTRFLENGAPDYELMPFIAHLILSKPKLNSLVEDFGLKNLILQYGVYALDSGLRGMIYNSIYVYLLQNLLGNGDDTRLRDTIEKVLFNDLFTVNVYTNGLDEGYVWVFEQEKNSMEAYRIEDSVAFIKSASCNMNITIMDLSQKIILNNKYRYSKMVQNADERLYKYFIDRGYTDNNLYIALAKIYTDNENTGEEYIDVLNKTLGISLISRAFRMQVGAALGNILSLLHKHDKALEYFNEVDENNLNPRYIEIMLSAFVNAKDSMRAMRLIVKKREFISDKTLAVALKSLSADKALHPAMADAAYELLIKHNYDNKLLDIVIESYNGSHEDWFILRNALSDMGISYMPLDEKILNESFYIHDFSEKTQIVFHRLYRTLPLSELMEKFIYFACYEMLYNLTCPGYEIIDDLESAFENTNDRIIAYALSRIYLKYNVSTLLSQGIMVKTVGFMEDDSIILPEFKEVKDKNLLSPYIEKSQPFIYKAAYDKKVYFYYKINGAPRFEKKEMKHVFFGMFMVIIPLFFDEEVTYFISEEIKTGSINTKEFTFRNSRVSVKTKTSDIYFSINNALIYGQMFKCGEAEKIITELIKQGPDIIGKIL
ncbi:MAG: DUF5717 family protein [Clostridiales bacterium]|jgi:hypothetical protein|nr:DUF5717 family protein [Clostridiales bacterium]